MNLGTLFGLLGFVAAVVIGVVTLIVMKKLAIAVPQVSEQAREVWNISFAALQGVIRVVSHGSPQAAAETQQQYPLWNIFADPWSRLEGHVIELEPPPRAFTLSSTGENRASDTGATAASRTPSAEYRSEYPRRPSPSHPPDAAGGSAR